MAPRREPAALDLETAVLAIPRRRRFREADDAAFAVEIQAIVGEDQRALPDAAVLPRDLTRIELQRREDRAVESVEMIADEHRRRMVVLHLPREIDLARADSLARRRQLEERRAGAVVGRQEHAVAPHDRRRDVGDVVGNLAVAPQPTAAVDVDADDAVALVKKIAWLTLPTFCTTADE